MTCPTKATITACLAYSSLAERVNSHSGRAGVLALRVRLREALHAKLKAEIELERKRNGTSRK